MSIEKYKKPPTEWVTYEPKLAPTMQCQAGPYADQIPGRLKKMVGLFIFKAHPPNIVSPHCIGKAKRPVV